MADISIIKLPNGTSYNLKDASARQTLSGIKPDEYVKYTDMTVLTETDIDTAVESAYNSVFGTAK